MKILHISTTDGPGGAGLAALRLHQSLLDQGIESKMLVANSTTNIDSIFVAEVSTINKYNPPKNVFLRFLRVALRKLGIGIPQLERDKNTIKKLQHQYPAYFTFSMSSYEVETHPLIEWADIIHLHWIQNFVNFDTFFKAVQKPIVWTFHDLNPMFGGFHHFRLRDRYYCHYKEIENRQYVIKKSSLKDNPFLHIVAISSQMEDMISRNEIYKDKEISKIHNSVDYRQFQIIGKETARSNLGITLEKKVFLFISRWINDSEKGLLEAIRAMEKLNDGNNLLLCVGEGSINYDSTLEILHFDATNDISLLSKYYSASDFLLFTSFQEAFSLTPLESMCCGTPVIMTPVSGASDLINDNNGAISEDFSVDSIVDAIKRAVNTEYESLEIRNYVMSRFSPEIIASKYVDLYNSIIGQERL